MSAHLQVIKVESLLQGAQCDATEVTAPQELHALVGHNDVVLRLGSRGDSSRGSNVLGY
jgi:hypothetical protein